MFFSLHRVAMINTILFFLLINAFSAEALLIRGGGRGGHADSNSHEFQLVDDIFVNHVGLDPNFTSINSVSINSGLDMLLPAPSECYRNFASQQDLEDEILHGGFVPEPCYYAFYLGSDIMLEFDGYMNGMFSAAESVDVVWTLSSDTLPDRVFSENRAADDNTEINFNAAMPLDIVPGEYWISVALEFHSGDGKSFFSSFDTHDDGVNCDDSVDPVVCGLSKYGSAQDSLSFSSLRERVVIFEGAAPINEPTTMLLMLSSGLLLFRRLKK